jgi:hypothetical protein
MLIIFGRFRIIFALFYLNFSCSKGINQSKPPFIFAPLYSGCSNTTYSWLSRVRSILPNERIDLPPRRRESEGNCNCYSIQRKSSSQQILCLPTVFIIGEAKAGTSSLYHYLMQDERFIYNVQKETFHTRVPFADYLTDFDDEKKRRRLERYISNFIAAGIVKCNSSSEPCLFYPENESSGSKELALIIRKRLDRNQSVEDGLIKIHKNTAPKRSAVLGLPKFMKIDATVDFHVYADVVEGIQSYFPNAKFILVVRDALERAVSSYKYSDMGKPEDKAAANLTIFAKHARKFMHNMELCLKWRSGDELPDTNDQWATHRGRNISKRSQITWDVPHEKGHPTHDRYVELRSKVAAVANPCHFRPFAVGHLNFFARSAVSSHMKWWTKFFSPDQIIAVDFAMLKMQNTTEYAVKEIIKFLGFDQKLLDGGPGFSMKYNGPNTVTSTESRARSRLWNKVSQNFARYKSSGLSDYKDVWDYFEAYSYERQLDELQQLGIRAIRMDN